MQKYIDENVVVELVNRSIVTDRFRRLEPEKKDRIYQTTIKIFGEYGYDGMAIDQLCREAGISKGSFFQYFPSKVHLLEFAILIFDDYLEKWIAETKQNEKAVFARDRLLYLFQTLVINSKLYEPEQRFYLFVTNALNHAGVTLEGIDITRHITQYVSEIIERGETTGEIRGDYDVELTTHIVTLIIGALLEKQYQKKKLTRFELEGYLISFLFDGIKA